MATLSLVVLAVIDPVLEIAALAVIAILLATPILGFLWIRVHSLTQLDRRSVGTARLITLLLGIEQAKAHSAEDAFVASWRENYAEELDAARRIGGIEVRLQTISDGCRLLAAPLFVVIAAASAPNAAVAVGIGLAGVAFVAPISNLSRTIVSVLALQGHVARIDDVLEEPPEDHLDVALDHDPVPVVIDRVTYRYAGADRAAVADVSAAIAPGSTVLVAGRSGSGKSTLARLVAGLLLPSAGEIRMRDDERRPRVGYVAQSISLFPGTLLSNVTFGREAPDEEVARALHGADLTEFVASLPMGLATNVIDAGPTFSGGQRQRIAIARALLNSPALLILDEATSNLDPESEARIVERFGAFSATKIVVAHRPAVLAAVDQVVYLENGCVAGIGTHEELMATEGYARLWAEPRVRML